MAGLTVKQSLFVDEYLKHFNATRAALNAGYSPKTAYSIGWQNLRKVEIAEVISQRLAETAMGPDEVLMRLAEQARAAQSAYLTANGVDMDALIRDGKGHLVKAIKRTQYGDNIEFYDAQAALVHIGKHHGLFRDIVESKSEIDLNVDEATERLFSRIDGLAARLRPDEATGGTGADE